MNLSTKNIPKFANELLNFAYVHTCLVCDEPIEGIDEQFLCTHCQFSMPIAPSPDQILNELIESIGDEELSITAAYSLFSSTDKQPFMKLIYSMKYHDYPILGEKLGNMLANVLIAEKACHYDLVLPVPIHKSKRRERGYNQSDLIAQTLAVSLELPFDCHLLQRVKYTSSQTTLSATQRVENVAKIYQISDLTKIKGKTLLLVDDVLTTGSTLNSLATELLEQGAYRVDVATLLRA